MPQLRRSGRTPTPPRGPAESWHPAPGYLALALIVAVAVPVAWLWSSAPEPAPAEAVARAASRAAHAPRPAPAAPVPAEPAATVPVVATPVPMAAVAPMPPPARQRDPDGDLTPDLGDYLNPGEAPPMAEVIARLHAAGVSGGLGAFQPPGTRPPLIGLAVPDDYVLPEGYVRHHQATDDGQRIEPILMYSPDHRWYDAAGRPLPLPASRVVPLEHAPPGLSIRQIVLPPPAEPGK
jgi:hypothetical protein